MTTPNVMTEALRHRLIETYRQLPKSSQIILQLLSLIYEPIDKNKMVRCLERFGITHERGQVLKAPALNKLLDQLKSADLINWPDSWRGHCHRLVVETATRDAMAAGKFDAMVKALEAVLPVQTAGRNGPRYFASQDQLVREVRIAIYRGNLALIKQLLLEYSRYRHYLEPVSLSKVLLEVCNNPFDKAWFTDLPTELYEMATIAILFEARLNLLPVDDLLAMLLEDLTIGKHRSNLLQATLAEELMLRGQFLLAEQRLSYIVGSKNIDKALLQGWKAFLQGDHGRTIKLGNSALAQLSQSKEGGDIYFNSISGLFWVLALIKEGSEASLKTATGYTQIFSKQPSQHWLGNIYKALGQVLRVQQGSLIDRNQLASTAIPTCNQGHSLETLMLSLCLYWVDSDSAKQQLPALLKPFISHAEQSGYLWLAMEAVALLGKFEDEYRVKASQFTQNNQLHFLVDSIQSKPIWEFCLNALVSFQQPQVTAGFLENELRLAWFLTFDSQTKHYELEPREQKLTKSGRWSKGRAIALRRLVQNQDEFDYLTAHDLQVLTHAKPDNPQYGYSYNSLPYSFSDTAIVALVGHPRVVWADSPTVSVEIVKGEPELLIKRDQVDWLTFALVPSLSGSKSIQVVKETPTRLKVLEVSPEHQRIAQIIGPSNQLRVPESASERILEAMNAVSSIVTVHSDIGGTVASAEAVAADPRPHVHLLPVGAGLKVAVMARPFTQGGAYYPPGGGGMTVIAEIEGKRFQTTRDLAQEEALAQSIVAACPRLSQYQEREWEWLIEEPEDCLELLLELHALTDQIVLEWPEGESLKIKGLVSSSQFNLSIQRQRDWFAASGEIQIDETTVMDMQRLLSLLQQSPGRFVQLEDGQFLALTQTFRKRLEELRAFSEQHGNTTRFHPLAAIALEEFVEEAGQVEADKHWKAHLKRLKAAQKIQPEVPSTLQAELRDYQVEGFQWLARLAHWGVGACLADDMGLGKTLQALAMVLSRAPEGPTLVVAPTSVGMNWLSEAVRFAPTLNPIAFGGGDRQQLVDQLQPFDLVVCSYGLLQQPEVAEMLAQVNWQTVVLDEAQAIKNRATKRSQAAMKLQAGFKILTTGTPIENHLGELWNLFRFINPGLLGSLEHFNERFAYPIERYQDKTARQQLKKLIQPFMLRRTKQQVLAELPSRTEITLHVELSQAEMAFYEALRRDAIAKLTETDAAAGHKHLQVLAEIMKLRRACCNTELVNPDTPLPSAKLEVFSGVLEELLENHHKALVFSQFVDHLRIIRNHLDKQKIPYQYLDGSTPTKERKKSVEAFQSGEGDVFLISLKAGGTGLNLTAADYVIHMDPWWNPAVEDQASDRAHRIGQQRPVTIYRLVTKGTIEEKIVDLHQQKRDLADSLLEGTDISGKVSTEELLKLIKEA